MLETSSHTLVFDYYDPDDQTEWFKCLQCSRKTGISPVYGKIVEDVGDEYAPHVFSNINPDTVSTDDR